MSERASEVKKRFLKRNFIIFIKNNTTQIHTDPPRFEVLTEVATECSLLSRGRRAVQKPFTGLYDVRTLKLVLLKYEANVS
jgi:hypothetical protein